MKRTESRYPTFNKKFCELKFSDQFMIHSKPKQIKKKQTNSTVHILSSVTNIPL